MSARSSLNPHGEEPERSEGVSNHEAGMATVVASWFETRSGVYHRAALRADPLAALLTMRGEVE
jgi:hypothetical protein